MPTMNKSNFFLTGVLYVVAILTTGANSSEIGSVTDELRLHFKTGSVVTVEPVQTAIQWTDVQPDGKLNQRDIPLSDIQRLVLCESPGTLRIAQVRQLLKQLDHRDYRQRENAEERLADPDIGGPFVTMLTSNRNLSPEGSYRLHRVLARLNRQHEKPSIEFDALTLNDGTHLEGDAGDLRLQCEYRDQSLDVSRADLQTIGRPISISEAPTRPAPVNVKIFHRPQPDFYKADQTLIDFEKSPSGTDLPRNTDVSEMYVPAGLELYSERVGFVGISGYGFDFPNCPPKANSACVFEMFGSYSKGFKGIMEIRFCLPNQRSVGAGVHELGMFIAKVNHSRDFILEAYNVDEQVLARIESSDQRCVFAGVKSTEPIVMARVLANPYLSRLTRKIDEDFSVDDICFSMPVPLVAANDVQGKRVRLRNGDLLMAESLQIVGSDLVIQTSFTQPIQLPFADVKLIAFQSQGFSEKKESAGPSWHALLADRSVLQVVPGDEFTSPMFGDLNLDKGHIAALCLAKNGVSFPVADDFEKGIFVLVYPTCRIAAKKVDFSASGFIWSESEKLEQKLNLSDETVDKADDEEEDPTPNLSEIDYEKTSAEDVPTLWFQKPQQRADGTGLLRLLDGQQLVLSGGDGTTPGDAFFQIKSLASDAITISLGNKLEIIPLDKVLSIEFPTQQ